MSSYYLQDANGPSAEALISFSDLTLLLILPIAVGVLLYIALLIFSMPSFRLFTEMQRLEFLWTLLPMASLLALAIPSLSLLYLLDEVGLKDSTHKVIGHQWYWVYESLDSYEDRMCLDSYLSAGPVRLLDVDNSLITRCLSVVMFLITAADVLHSWTIPAFGLKADGVPGRLNSLIVYLSRAGIFYGQCSEICGSNHSFMPIKCEVLDQP